MISQATIEEVKKRLIDLYKPCQIYIFGSYAWGTPHEDSDLDLLIVVDHCADSDKHRLLVQGHMALVGVRVSKDLVLYGRDRAYA